MKKIIEKLKKNIKKANRWIIAKRVKRKLIKRRIFDYELELLNEKWIIKRINDGQVHRRKELNECQTRIQEIDLFINYFKNKNV